MKGICIAVSLMILLAGCSSDNSGESDNSSIRQTEEAVSSAAVEPSEASAESSNGNELTLTVTPKNMKTAS